MFSPNSSKKASRNKTVNIFVGGQRVGHVRDGVFYKTLSSSKHFLRKPPAIAFSLESVIQAEQEGATIVEIYDRDTESVYRVSMKKVWDKGFPVNRGYEPQIALSLDCWIKQVKGMPTQPMLFGDSYE